MIVQRLARMPRHPESLPESFPDPPPAGPHAVQVLRTYAYKHPGYPFAPDGGAEHRSCLSQGVRPGAEVHLSGGPVPVVRADRAGIRDGARAIRPSCRVIIVVPRYPDADGAVSGPPARFGQLRAVRMLQRTAPERVGIYNLENSAGVPIYVHAKICIVDDVWFTCGSDNFNRRSWTSDSELTCAVLDATLDDRQPVAEGARRLARDLRLEVWSEHLGLPARRSGAARSRGEGFDLWRRTAADSGCLVRRRQEGRAAARADPPPRAATR